MKIFLFGATNPTGSSFLDLTKTCEIHVLGRKPPTNLSGSFSYCDLVEVSETAISQFDGVLVSFAPIWLFASYIHQLFHSRREKFSCLKGIIACSSSSYATKRFAFNEYDKQLSCKLSQAHEIITSICTTLNMPCQILAPTLVYGSVNNYSDGNISKILRVMQKSPIIILPRRTGLRQPIHAKQLALIAYLKTIQIYTGNSSVNEPRVLTLGGDSILTYKDMIHRLSSVLDPAHKVQNCRVLCIPDRLYYFLVLPVLLINPKLFEALLRIQSDLAHFKMAHEILDDIPHEFPVSTFSSKIKAGRQ